jgi:heme-degrading monooxygenase HmoA
MTACNIVRFRVKPGKEEEFVEAHRQIDRGAMAGFNRGSLIKTGDRQFCFVGEWEDFSSIENARESMIGILDGFRDMLEDLGDGLGVTDPVSGEVVVAV